jgi:predicted SAM-dependent methyltransferase
VPRASPAGRISRPRHRANRAEREYHCKSRAPKRHQVENDSIHSMTSRLKLLGLGVALALVGLILLRQFSSGKRIADYLNDNEVRKLQIGAGASDLGGWLNTDIEPRRGQAYLDAAEPFPIPDNAIHYIFSEHVIEHLDYEDALGLLKECHRVLARGGKLRLATPNLLKLVELFSENRSPEASQYVRQKQEWHKWPVTADPECFLLNRELTSWGHRFVYTPRMLKGILESSGFKDVREFPVGESDDPVLAGIEYRARTNIREVNAYETMVFQAARK